MDRKIFGALLAYTALLLYLAAGLMTPLVIMILVLPVVALIFFLANQGPDFNSALEQTFSGSPSGVWNRVKSFPPLRVVLDSIGLFLAWLGVDLQETVNLPIQKGFDFLVGFSTTLVKRSLSFTLKLFIMAFTLFFIYRDGKTFLECLLALVPMKLKVKNELVTTVKNVLSKLLYGLFLAHLIQGLLASLGYWLAGLPIPLLLGAATTVAALIPIVGTALVWSPATLYLFFQVEIFQASSCWRGAAC